MLVTLKHKKPEFENWDDVAVKEDNKVVNKKNYLEAINNFFFF